MSRKEQRAHELQVTDGWGARGVASPSGRSGPDLTLRTHPHPVSEHGRRALRDTRGMRDMRGTRDMRGMRDMRGTRDMRCSARHALHA